MRISTDVRDALFERFFDRGAVLATEMHFHSGTSKRKYLIVLNSLSSELETLLFMTTSQLDFFKKHPSFADHVGISPGVFPFFPVETIIDCRGVISMLRTELKRRYREGVLEIVGNLPAGVMAQIDQKVTASRFISPRHKKAILGWK